jgi:hypothetical protein
VLAAVEELSYRPNLLAKGLKTRRTYTIGLLIPDIQNSFFTLVVRGVEDEALSRGYHLFLCNTDEDPEREDEYITELAKKRVDGLMVAPSARRESHVQRLRDEGVPFVFVDRDVEGVDADVVSVDNRAGMRLIAEHLVGLGQLRSVGTDALKGKGIEMKAKPRRPVRGRVPAFPHHPVVGHGGGRDVRSRCPGRRLRGRRRLRGVVHFGTPEQGGRVRFAGQCPGDQITVTAGLRVREGVLPVDLVVHEIAPGLIIKDPG